MRRVDMSGRTYGALTVISPAETSNSRVKWQCVCVCGTNVVVAGTHLRTGHTKSCGCIRSSARDRFYAKTKLLPNGCIEWTGGMNGLGYGQFYAGVTDHNRTGKTYAHRWSYEHFIGPISEGLHLDHLCRNRKCVNPTHLEPVTCQVNLLRGEGPSAIHAKKTHCPAGHEYSGENVYVHPKHGARQCRACDRERQRAKRESHIGRRGV